MANSPRFVIVSGDIGEGHQSAARAVAESLEESWPGCGVEIIETFVSMGGGSGPVLRWLYAIAVGVTPWLQQLWYESVARCGVVRWFYSRVLGGWAARALAARIAAIAPDAIVSTYPLASAGLGRLRRAGVLQVPVTAVLCDVAPHAFWIYGGVDRYAVVDDEGRERMRHLAPAAAVSVVGPVVRRAFRTPPTAVRARWGLPPDAMVVVISAGSLALGGVSVAVGAALAADERCVVVVLCGRDERTRARLERLARRTRRLRVLGWVEDTAGLTAVADVVVNNAGGVTAQEALACGRALVMFRPIPGHGRDSAAALARAGVATCCSDPEELTSVLGSFARDPGALAQAQRRAALYAAGHDLDELAGEVAMWPSPEPAGLVSVPAAGPRRTPSEAMAVAGSVSPSVGSDRASAVSPAGTRTATSR